MRLLHTSDWHLGQVLHHFERTTEHADFLAWLLNTLEQEQVDVLLIAGDIFDNANPSAASQRQLYRFLSDARLRIPHLNIVLIAGNHDSAGRLEASDPLLAWFDAVVVGQVSRLPDGNVDVARLVVPLKDRTGNVQAWCLAIPFLRPSDVPKVETSGDAYAAGVASLYRQAFEYACSLRQPGDALVAMGHCHMTGGEVSVESERRIVIGGIEALSANLFDPELAYVALGHLHLAQKVGGHEHIRYSGSPLPLSFSETNYPHQVLRVDIVDEKLVSIQPIPVPRAIELLRIPAKPTPLTLVESILTQLSLPDVEESRWPYLTVRVLLEAPEPNLRTRIEAVLQGKPVRLARIEITTPSSSVPHVSSDLSLDDLNELNPEDMFQQLYRQKYASELPKTLQVAFAELLAHTEMQA